MNYEIKGILVNKLEPQKGQGKNGEWVKQSFVLSIDGKFPKNVCLTAWNKSVEVLTNASLNSQLEAKFSIESREYKGNWYTDLKVFSISINGKSIGVESTTEALPTVEESNDTANTGLPF